MNGPRRAVVGALLAAVAAVVLVVAMSGDSGYKVHLELANAGGLIKGSNVRVDGTPVGKVTKIDVDRQDRVTAELRIDKKHAEPIGRDARATVQVDGLFGERYVDLNRGDVRDPLPSGSTIPASHTDVSVRLDDVVDAADVPTREALGVFLAEQGRSLAGRGDDLAKMLAALPPTLSSTRDLVAEFGDDQQALARLVDESDAVLSSVARQRAGLGSLMHRAGGALDALGSRADDLGETVRRAPATIASANRALASLQGAATPLVAAAHGLRATAPSLTAALRELPAFSQAATPTLDTLRDVTPQLERLGRLGAPPVRRLAPMAGELATYGTAADPFSDTFNRAAPDLLGVMEGWARATQPKDAAGHVFRFGLSTSLKLLYSRMPQPPGQRRRSTHHPRLPDVLAPSTTAPAVPEPIKKVTDLVKKVLDRRPKIPHPRVPDVAPGTAAGDATTAVNSLLDFLLGS